MTVSKKQLVSQLKEVSQLLEVLGDDAFRARAFATAARQLDSYEGDFDRLLGEDRLTEIRGIGSSLAAELATVKDRGELALLEELRGRVPEGVRRLFAVSGLGAKKIAALWQSGIAGPGELLAAAEDGRLAAMKGFGKKSAENIAAAAAFALEAAKRYRLDEAEAYAAALLQALAEGLPGARGEVTGDLRRALETVGELELLVTGAGEDEVADLLAPVVGDVVREDGSPGGGSLRATLGGRLLRIGFASADSWGAVLALRTGGEAFARRLVERAAERGWRLDERGLFDGDRLRATPDEQTLFEALELPYVLPERREAETGMPPEAADLVTLADIRGLVHNHSNWSDGAAPLRTMVAAAEALGYRYLAMADHSKSSFVANGLTVERVLAQAEEVAAVRRELAEAGSPLELLHGIEVDILPDGRLDYPDEVLARLDYCVVSVHQSFSLSEAEQTARIVRAVHNPYARILAHASGRLLLRRPPYAVDLQAVITACAATGTVIEINANPRRLDLDWRWVQRARELGCSFAINPDAHHPDGYADLRYGVMMARKAGLAPGEVVNTAPTAREFLARLKTPGPAPA